MTPSPLRNALVAAGLACMPLAHAQQVESLFNSDADGWTVVDTPDPGPGVPPDILATYTPSFVASGGSPGGFVQIADPTQGPTYYWRAPAKFLGNLSFAYGGYVRFAVHDAGGDSYFMAPDVILTGAGLTLEYSMNALDYPLGPDWHAYSVDLNPGTWSNVSGDGSAPTPAQMQAVLGALDGLYIRGEYLNGEDTGSLDSVSLVGDRIFADGFEPLP